MLQVTGVAKYYGDVQALNDVSFELRSGEIVGLLGPNGAGKTTTMKIITGYLQADAGDVTVDGLNVLAHRRQVQAMIGYLPESAPLYPELTVQEYLEMIAELREIPPELRLPRLSEAIYATSLEGHLTRRIGELSKGFRQRVGIAQAIVHKPRLLILDEPSIGLDPTQTAEMRRLIRRLAEHSTVLFSTHILTEVEALCDRAIILTNGEIKADARLSELAGPLETVLLLEDPPVDVQSRLRALAGVASVESEPTEDGFVSFHVRGEDSTASDLRPAIFDLVRRRGWALVELRRDMRSLEEVFDDIATAV